MSSLFSNPLFWIGLAAILLPPEWAHAAAGLGFIILAIEMNRGA